jgi:hypothetical protein
MNPKVKVVGITAIATTAGWGMVLAGALWWLSRPADVDERIMGDFYKESGALVGFGIPNNHDKAMTIVIEGLRTNVGRVEHVELAQTKLQARESIVIGIRDLSRTNTGAMSQGGANGRQPDGAGTNGAPAAGGSHPSP